MEPGGQPGAHTLPNCCKLWPAVALREGSCLALRNALSEERRADQARDRIGKGRPGAEQEGEETQEDHSATGLAVSACGDWLSFQVVSGQSL